MGQIEWAMWANEQGVISSVVIIIGGIIGVSGPFRWWEVGAYALALGCLIFLIEYPRGKRKQGKKTVERTYQRGLTYFVKALGVIGRNYYIRFVFYLLSSVPCAFFLPTILGGFSLFFTSLIYLRAAISGETWKPCLEPRADQPSGNNNPSQPPQVPPPRNPRSQSVDNLAYNRSDSTNKI